MGTSYTSELQMVIKNLFSILEKEHEQKLPHEGNLEDCLPCSILLEYKKRYSWLDPDNLYVVPVPDPEAKWEAFGYRGGGRL